MQKSWNGTYKKSTAAGTKVDANPTAASIPNVWKSFRSRILGDSAAEIQDEILRLETALSDKVKEEDDPEDSTHSQSSLSTAPTAGSNRARRPDRWVDFFCIIGVERQKVKKEPNDPLLLMPTLLDCYPSRRLDMDFPQHIPVFCFPSGCRAVRVKTSSAVRNIPDPFICSMVLTSSAGYRLYCTKLTIYEKEEKHGGAFSSERQSEVQTPEFQYYLPKCLVLISHYPFFHAQSTMLKELLYTVQSGLSPIPFERLVAHIVHDIPLPPLGRLRIDWSSWAPLSKRRIVTLRLERPAPNDPFSFNWQTSFQPLARTVSVPNILVLWATLLHEGRVVLCCSKDNVALLTPIAEALLGLLFPLEWQGMYIPVLPSHMNDVLEAPVPYLVGIVSRLDEIQHPMGVLVYDLDEDVVHLGWTDNGHVQQCLPELPQKASRKLREELLESTTPWYLPAVSGVMGQMTVGDGRTSLDNTLRPLYATTKRLGNFSYKPIPRKYILSQASRVLPTGDEFKPEAFRFCHKYCPGKVVRNVTPAEKKDNKPKPWQRQRKSFQEQADRFLASMVGIPEASSNSPASPILSGDGAVDVLGQQDEIAAHLLDIDTRTAALAEQVRLAFFAFFADTLSGYQDFLDQRTEKLDVSPFLASLNLSPVEQMYMESVVQTQMFERFLQGKDKSNLFRRRYLDEQIILRSPKQLSSNCMPSSPLSGAGLFLNPSISAAILSSFGEPATKSDDRTVFLNSTKWQWSKTLVVPFPCSIGILQGQVFCADRRFPNQLRRDECVTAHTIPLWRALFHGILCSSHCGCPYL